MAKNGLRCCLISIGVSSLDCLSLLFALLFCSLLGNFSLWMFCVHCFLLGPLYVRIIGTVVLSICGLFHVVICNLFMYKRFNFILKLKFLFNCVFEIWFVLTSSWKNKMPLFLTVRISKKFLVYLLLVWNDLWRRCVWQCFTLSDSLVH